MPTRYENGKETVMALLENIEAALAVIRAKARDLWGDDEPPLVAIVLGTGLGGLAGRLDTNHPFATLDYRSIPGWPHVSAEGHAGLLWLGTLGGKRVALMQGRGHFYEGIEGETIALPIQCFVHWGVKVVVSTNAAGGLVSPRQVGSFVVHNDHVSNVANLVPLRGPNDDRVGDRFFAPPLIYETGKPLRDIMKDMAKFLSNDLQSCDYQGVLIEEGTYAMVPGPAYETKAETNFLRLMGVDVVGMSVLGEVVPALHAGCRNILAMSLVTDYAGDAEVDNKKVQAEGNKAAPLFLMLMERFVRAIDPAKLHDRVAPPKPKPDPEPTLNPK